MFFMILGTYRNQTFIDFSSAQRIQLMIFLCHTVTHGTDLRRSPLRRLKFCHGRTNERTNEQGDSRSRFSILVTNF